MGLLTVMLKDNIDLNSKSNFIQWYYHEEDDSNLDLHHEDSAKFSSDVKTLCKSMTINLFSQTKLMTIINSHVISDVAFNTLNKMEAVGENQFIDFLNDRLIYDP